MAQTMLLPTLTLPSSPDPTPLRMLAFSVAEAALQPDPNSPSLHMLAHIPISTDASPDPYDGWNAGVPATLAGVEARLAQLKVQSDQGLLQRRGKSLWDVVEKAVERRERGTCGYPAIGLRFQLNVIVPPSAVSPPISLNGYHFVLPANSSLARAVASSGHDNGSTPRAHGFRPPPLDLAKRMPLFTRSAEPSPVKPSFEDMMSPTRVAFAKSNLTKTRTEASPQPKQNVSRNFGKSLSIVTDKQMHVRASTSATTTPTSTHFPLPAPSRHTARLPSLKQIQAKLSSAPARKRGASIDGLPQLEAVSRINREDSMESIEVLVTPTDENVRPDFRAILHNALSRRSGTPPPEDHAELPSLASVPKSSQAEPRLAPFLRERVSSRLGARGPRPMSMPPLPSGEALTGDDQSAIPQLKLVALPPQLTRPKLQVTPPSFQGRQNAPVSMLATPPMPEIPPIDGTDAHPLFTREQTPFDSPRSIHTASPTLSVPIITCTPADAADSESEGSELGEGEVVLFDGAAEEAEREERERRGQEMKAVLRRKSG